MGGAAVGSLLLFGLVLPSALLLNALNPFGLSFGPGLLEPFWTAVAAAVLSRPA